MWEGLWSTTTWGDKLYAFLIILITKKKKNKQLKPKTHKFV